MNEENNDIRAELAALAGVATELDGGAPLERLAANDDDGGDGIRYDTQPQDIDPVLKGTIATLATMVTGLVCPKWEITPEEIDAVSESGARCLAHYFPDTDFLEHPAVGLGLTLAAVAGPRLAMRIPMKETPPEPENESGAPETKDVPTGKALQEDVLHVG